MTPSGSAIWMAAAALLAAGFFGSYLRQVRLTRAPAVLMTLGVGAGSFFNLNVLNVGGGLFATAWGLWLLLESDPEEMVRAAGACSIGAAVFYVLAPGPWVAPFAPASPFAVGVAAGLGMHFLARGGRPALAGALLAGPLAGAAAWTALHLGGVPANLSVGGGALYDAQAVAVTLVAVLAVVATRSKARHEDTAATGTQQAATDLVRSDIDAAGEVARTSADVVGVVVGATAGATTAAGLTAASPGPSHGSTADLGPTMGKGGGGDVGVSFGTDRPR